LMVSLVVVAFAAVSAVSPVVAGKGENAGRLRQAVSMLSKAIPEFEADARESALCRLCRSDAVDPAALAAELAASDDADVADFGLELMTRICVENPAVFDPNVFFMRYAAAGKGALPYVAEIIDGTDDDFCRTWACELFCEIYRHNLSRNNPYKARLDAVARSSDATCAKIKRFLSDRTGLRSLLRSGMNLSEPFRREWSGDARRPMKLMALLKLLDTMTSENLAASISRGKRIVDTYNFNYSILGRMGGKPMEGVSPLPPVRARLKRLAAYLKRTRDGRVEVPGGDPVSLVGVADAMRVGDVARMRKALASLKMALGAALRAKLLQGKGRSLLDLAGRFDHAVWGGGPVRWDDDLITVRNATGKGIDLTLRGSGGGGGGASLTLAPSAKGKSGGGGDGKTFHIPSRGRFVWFVPDGGYELELREESASGAMLSAKNVLLKGSNAEVVVVPGG